MFAPSILFPHSLHEQIAAHPEFLSRLEELQRTTGTCFRLNYDRAFFDRSTGIVRVPVEQFRDGARTQDGFFFATFQVDFGTGSVRMLDFRSFPKDWFAAPFEQTFFAEFFGVFAQCPGARKSA